VSGRAARAVRAIAALACASALAGCTAQQLQGQSSSYLIIGALQGANGADPSKLSSVVPSDVITFVDAGETRVATIFEDPGAVDFLLGMKDPGSTSSPATPTTTNFITVNRYHVDFVRADGRNTPGVDVPYGFDGAITVTVGTSGASAGFTLVRSQAKQEAPLKALAAGDLDHLSGGGAISTIARVTFYGHDQAGREVSAEGQISVNFANWGDPQ
jgi:hypothetical protein